MTSKCDCEGRRSESGSPNSCESDGSDVCPACGGRRADGITDALLAKLTQLARFGLAGEDGPLLEADYEGQ